MSYLKAKNWDKFQHFKDRRPPWIKLYRDILDDYNYHCLPMESKAIAPLLWLMASESETSGTIHGDIKVISFRLRMSESDTLKAVMPLISGGFFESDIGVISTCNQDDRPETEGYSKEIEIYKEEKEKNFSDFEGFWNCYGYKVGKDKSKKAYDKIIKSGIPHEIIIQGVKAYQRDCQAKGLEVRFFKHPATWLNGKHWEDEYLEGTASLSKEDEADRIKRVIEESKKCKSTNLLLT